MLERNSEETIENRVVREVYRVNYAFGKTFMYCYLEMKGGYVASAEPSVCMIEEDFDCEIGKRISRENVINSLWKLEAYRKTEGMNE